MPSLSIWTLGHRRTAPILAPVWTHSGRIWDASVLVPKGHYTIDAVAPTCSGRDVQFVAMPGGLRHITLALNLPCCYVTLDGNMFADAIYGYLPTYDARVSIVSLDGPLAPFDVFPERDGATFQVNGLRPGSYAVVIVAGGVEVSRNVTVGRYGDAVDASLTPEALSRIVAMQVAGSGKIQTFAAPNGLKYSAANEFGSGTVDGWTTPVPNALTASGIQLSTDAVRAIELVRLSIEADATLPHAFRQLAAWTVQVGGTSAKYLWVTLRPVDVAAWRASGADSQLCFDTAEDYEVDVVAGKVTLESRCYR